MLHRIAEDDEVDIVGAVGRRGMAQGSLDAIVFCCFKVVVRVNPYLWFGFGERLIVSYSLIEWLFNRDFLLGNYL